MEHKALSSWDRTARPSIMAPRCRGSPMAWRTIWPSSIKSSKLCGLPISRREAY
jgi:hypothetical protein